MILVCRMISSVKLRKKLRKNTSELRTGSRERDEDTLRLEQLQYLPPRKGRGRKPKAIQPKLATEGKQPANAGPGNIHGDIRQTQTAKKRGRIAIVMQPRAPNTSRTSQLIRWHQSNNQETISYLLCRLIHLGLDRKQKCAIISSIKSSVRYRFKLHKTIHVRVHYLVSLGIREANISGFIAAVALCRTMAHSAASCKTWLSLLAASALATTATS